jgi:hypothetical protein
MSLTLFGNIPGYVYVLPLVALAIPVLLVVVLVGYLIARKVRRHRNDR